MNKQTKKIAIVTIFSIILNILVQFIYFSFFDEKLDFSVVSLLFLAIYVVSFILIYYLEFYWWKVLKFLEDNFSDKKKHNKKSRYLENQKVIKKEENSNLSKEELLEKITNEKSFEVYNTFTSEQKKDIILLDILAKNLVGFVNFKDLSYELKSNKIFVLRFIKHSNDSLLLRYASEDIRNDLEVALVCLGLDYLCYEYIGEDLKKDKKNGLNILLYALEKDTHNYIQNYVSDDILSALELDRNSIFEENITDNIEYKKFLNSEYVKSVINKYVGDNLDSEIITEEKKKELKKKNNKVTHKDILTLARKKVGK